MRYRVELWVEPVGSGWTIETGRRLLAVTFIEAEPSTILQAAGELAPGMEVRSDADRKLRL